MKQDYECSLPKYDFCEQWNRFDWLQIYSPIHKNQSLIQFSRLLRERSNQSTWHRRVNSFFAGDFKGILRQVSSRRILGLPNLGPKPNGL